MENYIKDFLKELDTQTNRVSWKEIARAVKCLQSTYEYDGKVYLIGNGGSSAIASHFANDLNKTVLGHEENKAKRFQAMALSDNIPVLTAWANDVGFEKIFSEQLRNFAQDKDILIAISSSGNSANIIEAVKVAKELHLTVIALVGFDGGKLLPLADVKIHVPSSKYAIVESAHDSICHLITTYFQESISAIS